MNEAQTRRALSTLWKELLTGTTADGAAYVFNPSDPGLLHALDQLTAAQASLVPAGHTSSVAAHVDHLRYGLELLNRWAKGEDPFSSADYSASWNHTTVSPAEWTALREELARRSNDWEHTLQTPKQVSDVEAAGLIASIVHFAYHVGAIRQIAPSIAGPRAQD